MLPQHKSHLGRNEVLPKWKFVGLLLLCNQDITAMAPSIPISWGHRCISYGTHNTSQLQAFVEIQT